MTTAPRPYYATAACTIGLHDQCWIVEPKLASLAALNGCDCPCHRTVSDHADDSAFVSAAPAEKRRGRHRATDTTGAQSADAEQQHLALRMLGAGCALEEIAAATGYTTDELQQIRSAITERMMVDTFLDMGRKGDPHDHD